MITRKNTDTFLFGSKSNFDSICLEIVSELKEKYPHIKRIYVRAEFPNIDDDYKKYLLQYYEDTYYPEKILNAGRAVYIKRNFEMIDKSEFCIIYYDVGYSPSKRKTAGSNLDTCRLKSGTKAAYDYAVKKKKEVINMCTTPQMPT